MGRITTMASSKGGVSRSAIVMLLSGNLAQAGYNVAVVDADPNACPMNGYANESADRLTE